MLVVLRKFFARRREHDRKMSRTARLGATHTMSLRAPPHSAYEAKRVKHIFHRLDGLYRRVDRTFCLLKESAGIPPTSAEEAIVQGLWSQRRRVQQHLDNIIGDNIIGDAVSRAAG